jgi:serine/threonine protein kinase
LEQILAHPASKPSERMKKVHENVDPAFQTILAKILCFDPKERTTISELLSHPIFGEIRQEANECAAEKKLYLKVDQLGLDANGEPVEYSSRKLLSYLSKIMSDQV